MGYFTPGKWQGRTNWKDLIIDGSKGVVLLPDLVIGMVFLVALGLWRGSGVMDG